MTTKQEFRLICAQYGTQGHSAHAWSKRDMAKAVQAKVDADHHSEMNPGHFYAKEAPYVIQVREVGQWEDAE